VLHKNTRKKQAKANAKKKGFLIQSRTYHGFLLIKAKKKPI
jgi:hypothetical protein